MWYKSCRMLTHCYLGFNKLSSLFLNSVGLKMETNIQGGNCIRLHPFVCYFIFFCIYFCSSLTCECLEDSISNNKIQTPVLEKCPLFIVLFIVIHIL